MPNGGTSDASSEAEGGQGDEQAEVSGSNEGDAASSCSETTSDPHRAIVEDIRLALSTSVIPFKCGSYRGS